jgi:starch-binding outer membrane protein, SusD/RagB family
MKRIHIKTLIATVLLSSFLMACQSILEETPRSNYTPEYFKTTNGVNGGLTSLYASLRDMYGNGYYLNACQTGTDEYTFGSSADDNFKVMDLSNQAALNSSSSRSDVLWNSSFSPINTASGIIENGTAANISAALLAEARFFRAFDYFMLVQTFGGVPLDLGAGELKFNTSSSRTSVRNTVPEVYTKCIFPDLQQAITDLPTESRLTGTVTKTVARLFLAKAYLTYGWWLENPNSIPTYPLCDRTDPDGHDPAWYFQQAYTVATTAIANPGPYALQTTFYDVNVGSNDRNTEILLYADHTQSSDTYNGVTTTGYGTGASPENFASWMTTFSYTGVTSSLNGSWAASTDITTSVNREAVQSLGRPWVRMAPCIDVFENTFADKTNDSRYDGTFTTVFRGNWNKNSISQTTLYNANNMPITQADAVFSFLDTQPAAGTIDYSNKVYQSTIGLGVMAGRSDFVVGPEDITRTVYPNLWKIGPYRTDNGTGLGEKNAGSTRPFSIAKFSELFLVAAEAAVKGAPTTAVTGTYANDGTARGLINVLRMRAGKWKFKNSANASYSNDLSAVMIAATPAAIDINYILAERSRELFGEGYRWFDLVRTQKWTAIAGTYKIGVKKVGDGLSTITRTILPENYLRPIPQGEIDGLMMTDDEKTAYQNPGYR